MTWYKTPVYQLVSIPSRHVALLGLNVMVKDSTMARNAQVWLLRITSSANNTFMSQRHSPLSNCRDVRHRFKTYAYSQNAGGVFGK